MRADVRAAFVALGLIAAQPVWATQFHEPVIGPAIASQLDPLFAAHNWPGIAAVAGTTHDPVKYVKILDWLKVHVDAGSSVFLSYLYSRSLWVLADVGERQGKNMDGIRDTAAMMLLYSLGVVSIDGASCADVTAAGGRMDYFIFSGGQILKYLKALPADKKKNVIDLATKLEAVTSAHRDTRDMFICGAGLDAMAAGLKAGAVQKVQKVPGYVGSVEVVKPPADYKLRFLPEADYRSKLKEARSRLPSLLAVLAQ